MRNSLLLTSSPVEYRILNFDDSNGLHGGITAAWSDGVRTLLPVRAEVVDGWRVAQRHCLLAMNKEWSKNWDLIQGETFRSSCLRTIWI